MTEQEKPDQQEEQLTPQPIVPAGSFVIPITQLVQQLMTLPADFMVVNSNMLMFLTRTPPKPESERGLILPDRDTLT